MAAAAAAAAAAASDSDARLFADLATLEKCFLLKSEQLETVARELLAQRHHSALLVLRNKEQDAQIRQLLASSEEQRRVTERLTLVLRSNEQLKARVAELQTQAEGLEGKAEEATASAHGAQQRARQVELEAVEAKAAGEKLAQRVHELNQRESELEAERQRLLQSHSDELERLKRDAEEKRAELQRQMDDMRVKYQERIVELSSASSGAGGAPSAQVDLLRDKVQQLKKELLELRQQNAELVSGADAEHVRKRRAHTPSHKSAGPARSPPRRPAAASAFDFM